MQRHQAEGEEAGEAVKHLLLASTLLVALLTSACSGGAVQQAQQMIRYSGYAIRDVDTEVAPHYREAHEAALAASPTSDAYHLAMRPWDAVESGLRISYSAFLAADQAIEATGKLPLLSRVACLVASLATVLHVLVDVRLPIPPSLTQALGLAASYTGQCVETPAADAGVSP